MNLLNNNLYKRKNTLINDKSYSQEEFIQKINNISFRYHINHPFDKYLMEGKATKELMQSWVCNRYYYQATIPQKDSAILSNCNDRNVRQKWILNVLDHDNVGEGLDCWVDLGMSIGLTREEIVDFRHVLPGVKFACDAYYNFAKNADYKIAIASCLTVNFASNIHKERVNNWPKHYEWLDENSYKYFRERISKAKHEKDVALSYVIEWFKTPEEQAKVIDIIKFKQDILWSILDNLYLYHFTSIPFYS